MEIFKTHRVYNFLDYGKPLFIVSIALIIASIIAVFIRGINFGIDFIGGTVIQLKYHTQKAPIDAIREKLSAHDLFKGAIVTEFGEPNEIVIKISSSSSTLGQDIGEIATQILKETGNFELRRVDMVGPKVGEELKQKGIISLTLALIAIMVYVGLRYEWRFAIAAIIALIHDITITIGAISLYGFDVNLEALAALLTILGYSINDTVIVFDRIRERIIESKESDFKKIINESVSMTLSRTTLTSLTVFFVVLTLYIFGGEIMVGFSFPLIVGVIVGTYSSIFIAAQLVLIFGFDVNKYKKALAEKEKRRQEKERLRAQFERGTI